MWHIDIQDNNFFKNLCFSEELPNLAYYKYRDIYPGWSIKMWNLFRIHILASCCWYGTESYLSLYNDIYWLLHSFFTFNFHIKIITRSISIYLLNILILYSFVSIFIAPNMVQVPSNFFVAGVLGPDCWNSFLNVFYSFRLALSNI